MRILYICGDQGIPAFGRKGASTHLREMIAAMRAQGHEICLVTPDPSGDRRPDEDFRVVKLPRPRSKLIGSDGRHLLANYLSRSVLLKTAHEFRPDAIYERSALYFTAGEWLARRTGLPRVLEVNSFLAHEQRTRLHFPGLAQKYEHHLVTNASAIASISGYMKRQLIDMGCRAERVRPFPMAVDPSRFTPVKYPHKRREELGWPEDALVLGYVGSMNTYHRPNWFMDLAEKILRREPGNFRFLVVGGSASKVQRHRSRLIRWVDEGLVQFTGSIPQSDMAEWLAAMSVVLVPGAAPQSTPTKIFEAAAVGCPMILPATEPIKEICGKDAPYLFTPDDFRSFEEKVHEFAQNPAPIREHAEKLRDLVVEEYTWEHHAREIVKWLEGL